tara:strand:- start:426 stop:713 length:288 start_codon:yes stop_codon:yes gene_type:complete
MAKPTIFDLLGIAEEEGGAVSLPVAVERGLPIESLERLAGELKLSPAEFACTNISWDITHYAGPQAQTRGTKSVRIRRDSALRQVVDAGHGIHEE